MKDFFISYTKADHNWAEWIAWELEETGYTTVLQAWDSRPGKNFVIWMQQAASEAKRTIAILSQAYLEGSFTQPEWIAAFQQDPSGEKGTLLPVRVEECDLKGLFLTITYIDLAGQGESVARERLFKGVQLRRIKPRTRPGFPGGGTKLRLGGRPEYPGSSKTTTKDGTITKDEPWDYLGRRKWSSINSRTKWLIGLALISIFISLWIVQRHTVTDTSKLIKLETSFYETVKYDPRENARFSEQIDYFFDSNKEFITHFDSLQRLAKNVDHHLGISFFMGGPGVGKSLIFKNLKASESVHLHKVALADVAAPLGVVDTTYFSSKSDLITDDGSFSFSSLPTLKNPKDFSFLQLLEMAEIDLGGVQDRPLMVLIDGIDEVHPEFSELILLAIHNYIKKLDSSGNPTFAHIFVLGRPEGFKEYLTGRYHQPEYFRYLKDNIFVMKVPEIRTAGDLRVVVEEYQSAFGRLRQNPLNNLKEMVVQHDFVLYTMQYLSYSNFLIQEAALLSASQMRSSEQLKDKMLSGAIDRNKGSHGRPASNNKYYYELLRKIAKKYASEIDDQGFFEVNAQDDLISIEVGSQGKLHFKITDVLDRSGLAFLDPPDFAVPRYRFEPIWIHRYLVEGIAQ